MVLVSRVEGRSHSCPAPQALSSSFCRHLSRRVLRRDFREDHEVAFTKGGMGENVKVENVMNEQSRLVSLLE